jgi:hypothetical protein
MHDLGIKPAPRLNRIRIGILSRRERTGNETTDGTLPFSSGFLVSIAGCLCLLLRHDAFLRQAR